MPADTTTLSDLKKLVARHPRALGDYWEIGRRAHNVMADRGWHQGRAADAINLEVATLRQAIKFSQRIGRGHLRRLQKAAVPWRGVMYLLGVEDPKRFELLLQQILEEGLTNSSAIRKYIDSKYGMAKRPRMPTDLSKSCDKACEAATRVAAVLDSLVDVVDGAGETPSRRAADQLQAALDKLSQSIGKVRRRLS